jgi:hypothetical protein
MLYTGNVEYIFFSKKFNFFQEEENLKISTKIFHRMPSYNVHYDVRACSNTREI